MWSRLVKLWGWTYLVRITLIFAVAIYSCYGVNWGSVLTSFPPYSDFLFHVICKYDLQVICFPFCYIQFIPLPHNGVVNIRQVIINPANCGSLVDLKLPIVYQLWCILNSEQSCASFFKIELQHSHCMFMAVLKLMTSLQYFIVIILRTSFSRIISRFICKWSSWINRVFSHWWDGQFRWYMAVYS